MKEQTKEKIRELAREKRHYKMDEVGAALIEILEEDGYNKPGKVIPKRTLLPILEELCKNNRYDNVGIYNLPSVENHSIKDVTDSFIENNWSDITTRLAERKEAYIVWEGGDGGGQRLGTLEEYADQQEDLARYSKGMVETHNRRSDIIREKGGQAKYISLQLGTGE